MRLIRNRTNQRMRDLVALADEPIWSIPREISTVKIVPSTLPLMTRPEHTPAYRWLRRSASRFEQIGNIYCERVQDSKHHIVRCPDSPLPSESNAGWNFRKRQAWMPPHWRYYGAKAKIYSRNRPYVSMPQQAPKYPPV